MTIVDWLSCRGAAGGVRPLEFTLARHGAGRPRRDGHAALAARVDPPRRCGLCPRADGRGSGRHVPPLQQPRRGRGLGRVAGRRAGAHNRGGRP